MKTQAWFLEKITKIEKSLSKTDKEKADYKKMDQTTRLDEMPIPWQ